MFRIKYITEIVDYLTIPKIKGKDVQPINSGTTAQRPDLTTIPVGYEYYDTTLSRPLWKKDSTTWTDINTSNIIILSATATLNFPVIAAGESAQLTATVTGAAELDPVEVGAPSVIYNSNGADVKGFVSEPNTVTIRIRNNGASSIDPGEGQFKIKVFK